jgi:hypothetical protein
VPQGSNLCDGLRWAGSCLPLSFVAIMLRCVWLAMAASAWLAGASPACADEEVVELRYVAPPGCPTRDAVEAAVRVRTPNVRLAEGSAETDVRGGRKKYGLLTAQARRVFAITIEATVDGFRGTLQVDRGTDKELSAQRCEDLATALALVTALAIDPTASITPLTPSRSPESAGVGTWSLGADVDGMVEAGVSPGALVAAVVAARARVRQTHQLELSAIAGHDSIVRDGAQARFTWLTARLGACRLWVRWGIALGACGDVDIGAVRASGEMIVNQRELTRLWLAAGVHGSAQVPFGSRIFGQLQLGASLPFVRDRYVFAPNVELHETPIVTGWLTLGVGIRFL